MVLENLLQVLLIEPLARNIHDQNDNAFADYFPPLFTMRMTPFIGFGRPNHLGYIWDCLRI